MPTKINVSGTWRDVIKQSMNVSGTWRSLVKNFTNDNGTYRDAGEGSTPFSGLTWADGYGGQIKNFVLPFQYTVTTNYSVFNDPLNIGNMPIDILKTKKGIKIKGYADIKVGTSHSACFLKFYIAINTQAGDKQEQLIYGYYNNFNDRVDFDVKMDFSSMIISYLTNGAPFGFYFLLCVPENGSYTQLNITEFGYY